MKDKERVSQELENAAEALDTLLLERNVDLMTPSDVIAAVAIVLKDAADNLIT